MRSIVNRKVWILCLVFIVLLNAALFANGGPEDEAREKQAVSPADQFPIVEEKITIKAFMAPWGNVEDYQDNDFVRYVEEQTNIRLEVDVAKRGPDADQKRNILLASGDYPELFINGLFTKAEHRIYGDMGVFIPLNDLIAEYGVNTRKVFSEYPMVEANMKMSDGTVYSLPDVNDCFHCSYGQKMWIYQPWLDKLGLDMPTTTEEFKDVLIAFRDGDPNGNGLKDEIPLSGMLDWGAGLDGYLMSAFVYTPGNFGETSLGRMYVEDGKITAAFVQPAWKDGLAYMNDLYNEGLLSADAFIQDSDQYLQLGENPDAVLLGAAAGPHMLVFVNYIKGEKGRWQEYKAVPPLEGPQGLRVARYYPVYGDAAWTVTDKAANPEAAFRLGDAFYSEDFMLRNSFGREGIDWVRASPGEIGINGLQALYKHLVAWGESGANRWDDSGPLFRSSDFRLSQVSEGPESLEVILYEETRNKMEPYSVDINAVIPPLTYGEDAALEVAELENALRSYVVEMIGRFTIGDANIETEWEAYLDELETIGLPRYIELVQEAYDKR